MERILLIETSTALCSAALAEDGVITAYKESSAPKAHASLTAVFIQEMLSEHGLTTSDCDAVCVSMGPGSYTGLRVGVSTAKGLCFGSGKPLLAVGTLDTLVAQAISEEIPGQAGNDGQTGIPDNATGPSNQTVVPRYIIPMIDARRMEVYTAVFAPVIPNGSNAIPGGSNVILNGSNAIPNDSNAIPGGSIVIPSGSNVIPGEAEGLPSYRQITETAPVIIDENSFAEYLEQGPVLFIGDGAGKCADVIRHPNAHFCQCYPKASAMLKPALQAYKEKRFEDVAYFEPFYLKEFVATVSKKKLW